MLLLGLAGCFHAGLHPSTGDLVPSGTVGVDVDGTLATVAPGVATLETGREVGGSWGVRRQLHPLMIFMGWHAIEAGFQTRIGVARGSELDLHVGYQELGGRLRFALASEDAGDGFSAALGFGAGWRPLIPVWTAGGPRYAVGLDLSRRGSHATPLLDLQLSWGPEAYSRRLPPGVGGCGSWAEPGCGEYGPGQSFDFVRDELRLTSAVGVSTAGRDVYAAVSSDQDRADWTCDSHGCHPLTWALVPYVVLADGHERLRDVGSSVRAVDFAAPWGMSVQLGGHIGGPPPAAWPLDPEPFRFEYPPEDGGGTFSEGTLYRGESYGQRVEYWPSGGRREAGALIGDRQEGLWTTWAEDGTVTSVVHYWHDVPWDIVSATDLDGNPVDADLHGGTGHYHLVAWGGEEEGAMVRGEREGEWVRRSKAKAGGVTVDRGSYRHGEETGAWHSEGPEGTWDRSYRRGHQVGEDLQRYANGLVKEQGSYRHGHRRGWWIAYYPDGTMRYCGKYTASNTGPWMSYREDGTVESERP